MRHRWARAMPVLVLLVAACAAPDATGQTPGDSPGGTPTATPVRPLGKVDSWRDGLQDRFTTASPDAGPPYGLVEIAYDRAAAERAWAENVPDDLPLRSGIPEQEGRYGDLESVDFDTEAVVVWSSGQSGSCPGWLASISPGDGEGGDPVAVEVEITTGQTATTCTDDYNPYRMVLAVERAWLPDPASLPIDQVVVDDRQLDVLVDSYPTDD